VALWLLGVPKRQIAEQLGFDVKTVRRYLAAAKRHGAEGGLSDWRRRHDRTGRP